MMYPDMTTASGQHIYFRKPELTKILLEDLAVHASNICRYNGAVRWPLINHLALCIDLAVDYQEHLETYIKYKPVAINTINLGYVALHDFHEIYTGDMVTGLKTHCKDYSKIENNWERWVHKSMGLPKGHPVEDVQLVKLIDRAALCLEMSYLNHPAAKITLDKYPELTELVHTPRVIDLIDSVAATSLETNAQYVIETIQSAQDALKEMEAE